MIELDRQSPSAAHWSRQQYETLFATSDPGVPHRFVWVADNADELNTHEVIHNPAPVLALLVVREVDRDWELENIVVTEKVRRGGIGTRLLRELLNYLRAQNASAIFLEVREANQSARSLYRKLGFVETGSRRGYYSAPREDAILYRFNFY